MIEYISKRIVCPHCGHHTRVELDASQGDQEFYEDCMACCNPIHLRLDRDGLDCEREEIERKPVASHNYNRRN